MGDTSEGRECSKHDEVEEQKNLTLGQQNRRAYPLDSRRSRDLLFPANDLTPTESHEGGSFLE
ncbi:unnamed protein product, partial [Tetraodon nigroviridis]